MSNSSPESQQTGFEIAIVGMAVRLPGAASIEQFWDNLREGVEAISFFTEEELRASGVSPELLRHPDYVRARAVLEDAEMFDAQFFGYSPREAEIMDPQQRLFLECAWEALESAGYDPARYKHPVGVYAGVGMNSYAFKFLGQPEALKLVGSFQAMLGNDKDFLSSRVSYKLNLRGPSVSVQTACSTSLVAVHLACQGLLSGECSMALAGGVSVAFPERAGYVYQKDGILSPDGRCRAFDAGAQGTVGGSGVGVVVLKRLAEALAEGDTIHAVIKGSAVNNDGSLKIGYTAPSEEGQLQVIRAAQLMAEVPPETITYVEAHGTGTNLGDPIEMAALTRAFRAETAARNFCAVGSVKTNIGHLDTAAGVVGLIKTTLALKHREIPPSLHFERPNPKIDFEASPFYVNDRLSAWKNGGAPRRAGVSSFGIGGTNAHVVLEEAPAAPAASPSRRRLQLLVLSAKTEAALERATARLVRHLKAHAELNVADVAYTLQAGRGEFAYRRCVVCSDTADAADALESADAQRVWTGCAREGDCQTVMLFPGQGTQYVNMGRGLYEHEEVFRTQVNLCAELLMPHLGCDVRELLFAPGGQTAEAAARLRQTAFTQPALFTVEYALAQQFISWGVRPSALMGHSLGEYVAACLAGVFSLEDALRLVTLRGRLIQEQPPGVMLVVPLVEAEVLELLDGPGGGSASLAAVNAPALCVVSGTSEEIEKLELELEGRGIEGRRLHTSHAFHSRMMEPAVAELTRALESVELRAPQIPFVSCVTGRWITETEARDAAYWGRQLREPVRFVDGVGQLLEWEGQALLEVGPGRTLSALIRQHPARTAARTIISSLPQADESGRDEESLLRALGRLWLAGVGVEWERLHEGEPRRRLPLPTYPFERQRFTIEVPRTAEAGSRHARPNRKSDVADWFYLPLWKQSVVRSRFEGVEETGANPELEASGSPEGRRCCVVFVDECGLGTQLAAKLRAAGDDVVTVRASASFERLGEDEFSLEPGRQHDYRELIGRLQEEGRTPHLVAHMWGVTPTAEGTPELPGQERLRESQERGFYSLLFLARALEQEGVSGKVRLAVVTNGVQCVSAQETLMPEKATALGPCLVISQEYMNITCRGIDIELPEAGTAPERRLLTQLVSELRAKTAGDKFVAYRGGRRWTRVFEALRMEDVPGGTTATTKALPPRLRERGVYLLTGGLGGIGLGLAEYLAKSVRARLILVGRTELPPRERWAEWVATHGEGDAVSRILLKLRGLEEAGAELELVRADVAHETELREAVRRARERFGALHGVIHAAGLSGRAALVPVSETGRVEAERQFQAKVYGLLALEKVLRESDLDFCLLTSSLSTVLGGLGFAAYAAANAFMDAFAQQQSQSGLVRWVSVNWDGWHLEEGDAAASLHDAPLAITMSEGVEAFRRILQTDDLPQLVVSVNDLQARLDQWVNFKPLREAESAHEVKAAAAYARPELRGEYRAPRNPVEQSIADIWQALLGIERVGVEDNFFELGGHSLLATQLASRVRDAFHIELSLRSFFVTPTVAGLARVVTENLELKESRKLEQILGDVEALTAEEVERALSGDS